ncbi:acyl-CoA thioesterase [Endozoicomonas gorgoniicola]|uniref:Acyl-CoA thioesterase n=1 Tax=Endozoicomonas gorgoniicola TaxID=1234144 RepID=A0ABT3MZV4_9GAMM|nr:hotdog domain-containing protein [Endozoicomonas gorgoniicola]MCW7554911.1 acyl-CoA thioesterase [Endozoicomonas gorgoniicola]
MNLVNDDNPVPQGELTLKVLADNQSTNHTGDVFAGWVAMNVDQAGEIQARKVAKGRVVTVSIGAMSFMRPVQVGDIIGLYSRVTEVGKTSIRVIVEAWIENDNGDSVSQKKLTETSMVFVAVDGSGSTQRINR